MIDLLEITPVREYNNEPLPDIASCECGWRGEWSDCETETEGDWENGYYDVCICPNCDYGCLEPDMSDVQGEIWHEWYVMEIIRESIDWINKTYKEQS